MAWSGVTDILERRQSVAAASDLLAQLEGRKPFAGATAGASATQIPTGSPFLEGQTLTVAGAALLQRVADAVTKVGGSVLSSQVDVQGVQAKDGFVSVLASCEIDFAALQRLLYDLEAGMPYLFIEQFAAQAATTSTAPEAERPHAAVALRLRPLGRREMSMRLTPYLALAAVLLVGADARGANPPGAMDLPPSNIMPAPVDMSPNAAPDRAAKRSERQSALGDPALRADRDARPAAVSRPRAARRRPPSPARLWSARRRRRRHRRKPSRRRSCSSARW